MSGSGSGYDGDVTIFSPDGRIFQIDYAKKCVENSFTSLGIVCSDGIVLAAQKSKQYQMLVPGTNRRAYAINKNAGMVGCGMAPEGRYLLSRMRDEAVQYKKMYQSPIPGHIMSERCGHFMHLHTLYGSVRPVGSALIIGHYSKSDGLTLWSSEPCGTVQKWFGKAFGKGRQLANTEIEKLDLKTLTCEQSLYHIARIFSQIHDEQTPFEIEVNWIRKQNDFVHEIVPQERLEEARSQAVAALAEEDNA